MGRRTIAMKSHTLPSSPTHSLSSSSSEFEFRISLSPRKSSSAATADELFYKGQLLPLHLSPRLSLVRSLLASSSSARDSSGSSADSHSSFTADCDSSRPSSAADEDEFLRRRLNQTAVIGHVIEEQQSKRGVIKKFSFSRFSSVFKEASKPRIEADSSSIRRMSSTAKEVMRKYLKKVKPLYEKISQKQQQKRSTTTTRAISSTDFSFPLKTGIESSKETHESRKENNGTCFSHSFSGNLGYPRKKNHGFSCPSSMKSSPTHSKFLYRNKFPSSNNGKGTCYSDTSSMEELHSAIQGAIAHCKNSMVQDKSVVSSEI